MALHVHRAERADGLVEALCGLLAERLADPFAPEVVAVPTRGMERWLTQRLGARLGASEGRGDGVCANVLLPGPRRLVGDVVAAASGVDPETDPWRPERAVWPLLEVVEASLDEAWLQVLAGHLGAGDEPDTAALKATRRFATVRHLAGLLDRYAQHRPELVLAWSAGSSAGGWQGELWRRLRERIATPGPAERLAGACAALRAESVALDLPSRVSLFGITRLPAGDLEVLRALATSRAVHLLLLHPSPTLWDRVAAEVRDVPPVRRADDETVTLVRNRLLATWGQDARESQLVLAGAEAIDHHHPVEHGPPTTLLARVQADVRADRAPDPAAAAPLAEDDDSLQVHACHGRARQVEVVRDTVLHLLAEDPTLEPRDIVVLCPDIEELAPLVQAAFGAGSLDDDTPVPDDVRPPDLRVRLADRALRQTNPLLGVVARLLELATERVTASEVLDLAGHEPVRRRFGFDDQDGAALEEWVAAAGIRWGLDAEHRGAYGLPAFPDGTWRFGLDRVLVGVAMTEDDQRLPFGVLPLDDVESASIDRAGRFAELVDRLADALGALGRTQPVAGWTAAIAAAVDALCACAPQDAWQRGELQRLLDDVASEAAGQDGAAALAPAEVRALLGDRLRGRPTRANFRTGHLTVCTLVPMRAVPHRVVCLVGLDDGCFPRKAPRDGDDLLLDDPHVGDRDPRAEDRQLLLDAVLAATEKVVITYTGNDERTNALRPPAVPVGELLDVVDRTVAVPDGGRPRDRVVVQHPLQPFDPRNYVPGQLRRDRPWSFDRVGLEGARQTVGRRGAPPPFLDEALDPVPVPAVELEALVRFTAHPVRAFLRDRLGVRLVESEDEVADALPVQLDSLEEHGVGQRMLDARLAGADRDAATAAEVARGSLPPGWLAKPVVDRVRPVVDLLAAAAAAELGAAGAPRSVDVRALLPDGRPLTGSVPGVRGEVLAQVAYARVGPRHRLAAWVRLLALTASDPEVPWCALTLGRAMLGASDQAELSVVRIPPLSADPGERRALALEHLGVLADLRDRGLAEPLPLYLRTSHAFAWKVLHELDGERAAASAWQNRFGGEAKDPEHQLVLGGVVEVEDLLAAPPRQGEGGGTWGTEPSRFGRYACRLWAGPKQFERIEER